MCGIFGFSLEKVQTKTLYKLVDILGYYNDKRGGDSWGAFDAEKKKIHKDIGKISVNTKSVPLIKRGFYHTRKATEGRINLKNSHPFKIGKIVGAHNGMVSNHYDLNEYYNRECEVDSEHIFYHLDEGLDLAEIEAYGAIQFYNYEYNSLFLSSFDGDLSVAKTNSGIVWSSCGNHLAAAMEYIKIPYTLYEIEDSYLYRVVDDKLMKTPRRLNFSSFYSQYFTNYSYKEMTR